jgi:hypothetical protein
MAMNNSWGTANKNYQNVIRGNEYPPGKSTLLGLRVGMQGCFIKGKVNPIVFIQSIKEVETQQQEKVSLSM